MDLSRKSGTSRNKQHASHLICPCDTFPSVLLIHSPPMHVIFFEESISINNAHDIWRYVFFLPRPSVAQNHIFVSMAVLIYPVFFTSRRFDVRVDKCRICQENPARIWRIPPMSNHDGRMTNGLRNVRDGKTTNGTRTHKSARSNKTFALLPSSAWRTNV